MAVGLLAALLIPLATRPSHADQQTISIAPGDQLTVTCTTKSSDGDYMLTVTATNKAGQHADTMIHFHLANQVTQPTATATVQPTAMPQPTTAPPTGGMLGACSEPMDIWHLPVVTGPGGKSCATGHEHGDAPPAWISVAGYSASFHGHFNTSPKENSDKHAAMKGFAVRFNNVDIYFRVHAASNPLDRSARYHSYEV